MPLINPRYQSVAAHVTLYSLIACLKFTSGMFGDVNTEVKILVDETYGVFFKLYDNMTQINKECDSCKDLLGKMENDLVVAKTNLKFDIKNVKDMQESCFQLKNSFTSLQNSNYQIGNEVAVFKKNLNMMSNKFSYVRRCYWAKYGSVGAIVGGIVTGCNTDRFPFFCLGSFVGASFAALGMYCTSFKKTSVLITLKRLRADTLLCLDNESAEFRELDNLVCLVSAQFESADVNLRLAESATGIRVIMQADEMLKTIRKVKLSLNEIKLTAKGNAADLRSIMDLENVSDLISL